MAYLFAPMEIFIAIKKLPRSELIFEVSIGEKNIIKLLSFGFASDPIFTH